MELPCNGKMVHIRIPFRFKLFAENIQFSIIYFFWKNLSITTFCLSLFQLLVLP